MNETQRNFHRSEKTTQGRGHPPNNVKWIWPKKQRVMSMNTVLCRKLEKVLSRDLRHPFSQALIRGYGVNTQFRLSHPSGALLLSCLWHQLPSSPVQAERALELLRRNRRWVLDGFFPETGENQRGGKKLANELQSPVKEFHVLFYSFLDSKG